MARVTILSPTVKDTNLTVSGSVALLKVGDKRVRFVIQDEIEGVSRNVKLVHFASGMVVTPSNTILAIKLHNIKHGITINNREAAQESLDRLVKRLGADKVLAKIEAAEVINKVSR